MTDNKVSRRSGTSSKLLFVTILLSLVICILAVLIWINILKSKDLASGNYNKNSNNPSEDSTLSTPQVVNLTGDTSLTNQFNVQSSSNLDNSESLEQTSSSVDTQNTSPTVSMDIDSGLELVNSVSSASNELTDYISSQDYISNEGNTDSIVTTGVEIKKPAIAQSLNSSQMSTFSRDIVKYTEYVIQNGDSLDSIAQKFSITRETLISVNQIKSTSSLFIGSTLLIPDRNGTLYTVKEGDTLSSIVQQLNLTLSWKALSDVNGLRNDTVNAGDKLFIPLENVQENGTISFTSEPSFILPSKNAVTVALYNQKVADPLGNSAIQLDGILLQSNDGEEVIASETGVVIDKGFNDNGTGFVKILHSSGYTTYYDYLSNICVNSTDKVSQGDVIGYFATGSTNLLNPTIFFKIEQDGISLDPYSFL